MNTPQSPQPSPEPAYLPLVQDDPWLVPYNRYVEARYQRYLDARADLERMAGSLREFASAWRYMGFSYDPTRKGWWYREWAPKAEALFLIGDFNGWNRSANPLTPREDGIWELFLPDAAYQQTFVHGSRVKVHIVSALGAMDRMPAWTRCTVQDEATKDFAAVIWAPDAEFAWTDQDFDPASIPFPLIYESHTGMAQEEEKVGSYREFAEVVLPRVKALGYNAIQLMAVQEHPYYGSFGYHVSNFFAPSSRFGSPDDLKYLVNTAHRMGIAVIMDIVHSHAVKNLAEGLNQFDGSDDQYFHPGGRGHHTGWDSKLFNYGKREVQQFLLSNVAYWLEEFHFDGFRFDGVTSMLYLHHGDHKTFGSYDLYFTDGVEWDAVTYLQLANELAHEIKPGAITIAEDMSGMPGCCRKVDEGGLGFDYRLGMGIPDYWIKLLKHKRDEDWELGDLWYTLINRRWKEKTIAYAESHDQALVGDKTLAFWLMDKEMYWHMQVDDPNLAIDRGIALHKMIRLITATLGGEGYLNFMGNEFGHPEWIDFPREGNGWSHKYARRQWSLASNDRLKYQFLWAFDQAMIGLLTQYRIPAADQALQLHYDEHNMTLAYQRAGLVFLFNFHPTHAIPDYKFFVPEAGEYELILSSDDPALGGFGRIDPSVHYFSLPDEHGTHFLSVYNTNRTAQVYRRVSGPSDEKSA